MYIGFWNFIISVHRQRDPPLGESDIFFRDKVLTHTLSRQGGGVCEMVFDEEEYVNNEYPYIVLQSTVS
jgi:hypothetical protein